MPRRAAWQVDNASCVATDLRRQTLVSAKLTNDKSYRYRAATSATLGQGSLIYPY